MGNTSVTPSSRNINDDLSSIENFETVRKRKKNNNQSKERDGCKNLDTLLQSALVKNLNDDSSNHEPSYVKKDSDQLSCDSLVAFMKQLKPKRNKLARIKIMQVLYELEEDDND